MVPKSPEELLQMMRDLLVKNLTDVDKNLPINIVWEVAKLKDLMISYFYYQNNKNISKAARDLQMSRTTLSYHINVNDHIIEDVDKALKEDRKRVSDFNKKNRPPF